MVMVFGALSVLFLLLAVHPFLTYPLSLRLMRRRPDKSRMVRFIPSGPHKPLRFAICMCAYNEAHVIRQKMDNLLMVRQREPDLEILVYVDGATDSTVEILHDYTDEIRLFTSTERHGKTHGMNLLVANATAPILVFTDANVMLHPDALQKLRPYFGDLSVGCVSGHLVYTNPRESVTAKSGSLYWRLEEFTKRLEGESGSVMGADGSLFAIRRSLHQPPPDHLIDDMYVSLMILLDGYRIVQARDVTAYEASVSSPHEEFRRKARIACQAFNVHRLLWPRIRRLDALTVYKYVSHKLIRWFTFYSLSLSFLFLVLGLVAAGESAMAMILTGAVLAALAAGRMWTIRPFSQISDLVLALAGAGLGVWQSMHGERYQTWMPAASIRKS